MKDYLWSGLDNTEYYNILESKSTWVKFLDNKPENTKLELIICTTSNWPSIEEQYFANAKGILQNKPGEVYSKILEDGSVLIFLSAGDILDSSLISKLSQKIGKTLQNQWIGESLFVQLPNEWSYNIIDTFIIGLYIGAYTIYKAEVHPIFKNMLFCSSSKNIYPSESDQNIRLGAIIVAWFRAMDWLNAPPNFKTAPKMSEFLEDLAHKHNLEYKCLNRDECKKQGLGAYLAVNQGSKYDAAFTILRYKHPDAIKKIGIVGKCVLFDTGGVSIKPSNNMHYMKSDMGGASAAFGALLASAEAKLPIELTVILPITDNVIDNAATLPGDVVRAHNGKTIEILNTDAEGRLTLADGLSYLVQHYNPEVLIDLATLTGSAVMTFGNKCAAGMSNNSVSLSDLQNIGDLNGQRLWPLPIWDEFIDEFTSDVADFANISYKPYCGAITAAKFLEQFTHNHSNWIHLDIAGVAFDEMPYSKQKAATGFGVLLMFDYIQSLINK